MVEEEVFPAVGEAVAVVAVGKTVSAFILLFLAPGFFGKFFFYIYGIAGNIFATLAQKEPYEHKNGTAKD